MPAMVAGKPYRKSRAVWGQYLPEARLRRERGPRIEHLLGRWCTFLSQIVGGHTENDIRRCGGPIGSKRRQKS